MNDSPAQDADSIQSPASENRLAELALLFLKLGATAFGGPAAHIAMLEDEVVRRRKWLSSTEFLDLISVTNLIPGPNSTEMAIHIGYRRAGWPGLICAGCCFILPAFFIVLVLAWLYVTYGSLPAAASLLYGVKPVVIAIVGHAIWRLARSAVRTPLLLAILALSLAAIVWGMHELLVLFLAAAITALIETVIANRSRTSTSPPMVGVVALPIPFATITTGPAAATAALAATQVALWPIFYIFLKIGSVLFGSGYVLLAFLRADFVERLGWLTEAQLIDAVAVGQVIPGPVFTTATFIGFILAGPAGAIVATIGIFLPAFVFVAISAPFVPRLRRSALAGRFLDGLNIASLALMGFVSVLLAQTAIVDWLTAVLTLASLLLLIRYRINSAWLILSGALIGLAVG